MKRRTEGQKDRRTKSIFFVFLALCLSFVSCTSNSGKPASSNRQYEVILFGDADNILARELSTPVEGLPQEEPCFDVTKANTAEPSQWQKLGRALVFVKVDKKAKEAKVRWEEDVYAKPQIVAYITAPDTNTLRKTVLNNKRRIKNRLEAFEIVSTIKSVRKNGNEKAEDEILRDFGIEMRIPADLKASKHGENFLWLSNNTNEGLENICVYAVEGHPADFKHVRDSVMARNIPGETKYAHMETYKTWTGQRQLTGQRVRTYQTLHHGLWDMKDDAMGGPFVTLEIRRAAYTLYIEGFVYAPESKKRNKMRRLEACVLTAKIPSGRSKRPLNRTLRHVNDKIF